jgi:excisionase family DNA binding protein
MPDHAVAQKLSLQEAARSRGCSERTIRRYIAAGLLPAYRMGPRLIRVDAAELDAMLRPIPTASASGGDHGAR